jgi:UDP-N-acetylglucosamine--N-acetylmuramyl-(pentapeptide) pyrophosphoryl-undecaprenol N-acetylglucosamine transferase
MAIAELCVVKKPVVFVPFPFAAEDHQTVNAKNLVDKNAGLLVRDDSAKEKLVPTVIGLIKNQDTQKLLKENIGKLAVTNADEIIAAEILATISK